MCCRPERGHFAEEYPSAHANILSLERQLAEAQGKLGAVEEWRRRTSGLWGRWPEGADELGHILSKEGE